MRNDVFGYDLMGNPTSWKGTTRSFNGNNQETTGGSAQFSYNGNGNATTYKGNTLTYDEENHLTSFTTPSGSTPLRAVYRSDGLRAWKQVASGNRYLFLYDGDQIVCGFNSNGDLSRINVWGARGLVGRQSGTNAGTAIYDYLWDNRGNISQSVSPYGGVDNTYRVTAWGETTSDGGTYDPYRCMGGELGNYFDQETGLVLCGQRYYDPSGGRWLTRDPIEYDGGLNLYGYVSNNPVNLVDPSGLVGDRDGDGESDYSDRYDGPGSTPPTDYDPSAADSYSHGATGLSIYLNRVMRNRKPSRVRPPTSPLLLAHRAAMRVNIQHGIRHVIQGHGPNSRIPGKSRFICGVQIQQSIRWALKSDQTWVLPNTGGRSGHIFIHNFNRTIGTDRKGRPLERLKVVLDPRGNLITAYPIK